MTKGIHIIFSQRYTYIQESILNLFLRPVFNLWIRSPVLVVCEDEGPIGHFLLQKLRNCRLLKVLQALYDFTIYLPSLCLSWFINNLFDWWQLRTTTESTFPTHHHPHHCFVNRYWRKMADGWTCKLSISMDRFKNFFVGTLSFCTSLILTTQYCFIRQYLLLRPNKSRASGQGWC